MPSVPSYTIDPAAFWADPYPDLARMRDVAPAVFVPQLNAVLITRRDDIAKVEKQIAYFSSEQPEGLMTRLMGQNMMRKDGDAHAAERRAIFPAVSPRTVRDVWKTRFEDSAADILGQLAPQGAVDLVDIARRISGEALIAMTGLHSMTWQQMDRVSQGMIDGCANYAGDPAVEARCHECTSLIDDHIAAMRPQVSAQPDLSLLSVQMRAGMDPAQIRANIKLAISGGQNESRDVIAGLVWALLVHPAQLDLVRGGQVTWMQAFEEYVRWVSPIGMSPREMAQDYVLHGIKLERGTRVFLMFGAGNRDAAHFNRPDAFDVTRDCTGSLAFGAGPHFCAGAWASRCLIAEVCVQAIFDRLKGLSLAGEVPFGGWAFRGPLSCPVRWNAGP